MFADDVKVYADIVDTCDVDRLQCALDSLAEWAEMWQLPISICKCCTMRFGNDSLCINSSIFCVQVFRYLYKMAPEYLSTYCQPVSGISGRRHLRSADRGHLDFPVVKLASYAGRSFAYAGPSNWNSLPAHLRDNSLSLSSFRRHLKTFLFSFY